MCTSHHVGIDEAGRRWHTTPGFVPDAAYRRVRKPALPVCSLCDRYENLAAGERP
ncbi:hypothetical protein ABZ557_07125 [Streptomyces sp. NPDC019645]|uniref:hypothetical protein n=1 Tax=unclassified Streptomyces TaxID=2593676 RepID=UPI0033F20C91